jgi:hypothetical protein
MNIEAWDAGETEPPATISTALSSANYSPPPPLTRGNEPGEMVILIEAEVFSG